MTFLECSAIFDQKVVSLRTVLYQYNTLDAWVIQETIPPSAKYISSSIVFTKLTHIVDRFLFSLMPIIGHYKELVW